MSFIALLAGRAAECLGPQHCTLVFPFRSQWKWGGCCCILRSQSSSLSTSAPSATLVLLRTLGSMLLLPLGTTDLYSVPLAPFPPSGTTSSLVLGVVSHTVYLHHLELASLLFLETQDSLGLRLGSSFSCSPSPGPHHRPLMEHHRCKIGTRLTVRMGAPGLAPTGHQCSIHMPSSPHGIHGMLLGHRGCTLHSALR